MEEQAISNKKYTFDQDEATLLVLGYARSCIKDGVLVVISDHSYTILDSPSVYDLKIPVNDCEYVSLNFHESAGKWSLSINNCPANAETRNETESSLSLLLDLVKSLNALSKIEN